jgi:hypothetical protein
MKHSLLMLDACLFYVGIFFLHIIRDFVVEYSVRFL